jgi:hypothetical protein
VEEMGEKLANGCVSEAILGKPSSNTFNVGAPTFFGIRRQSGLRVAARWLEAKRSKTVSLR